jgi:hypothetical protein
MSFDMSEISEGILTVRFSGKPTAPEMAEFHRFTAKLVGRVGAFRLLVMLKDFQGFGAGNWNATSIQSLNDDVIDRIAIVGDKKWEDQVLMFTGAGLRRAEIEFFELDDSPKASAWLAG